MSLLSSSSNMEINFFKQKNKKKIPKKWIKFSLSAFFIVLLSQLAITYSTYHSYQMLVNIQNNKTQNIFQIQDNINQLLNDVSLVKDIKKQKLLNEKIYQNYMQIFSADTLMAGEIGASYAPTLLKNPNISNEVKEKIINNFDSQVKNNYKQVKVYFNELNIFCPSFDIICSTLLNSETQNNESVLKFFAEKQLSYTYAVKHIGQYQEYSDAYHLFYNKKISETQYLNIKNTYQKNEATFIEKNIDKLRSN